jgi:hypothetical protein
MTGFLSALLRPVHPHEQFARIAKTLSKSGMNYTKMDFFRVIRVFRGSQTNALGKDLGAAGAVEGLRGCGIVPAKAIGLQLREPPRRWKNGPGEASSKNMALECPEPTSSFVIAMNRKENS